MTSLDRERGRGRSPERRGRQTTYVVKKTVREAGNAQYPMLTRTNYAEWVVLMKVMLKEMAHLGRNCISMFHLYSIDVADWS